MRIHRTGAGLFAFCILVSWLTPASIAKAQGADAVALRLVHQTPYNGPDDPVVELTVSAKNEGTTALDALSLFLTIGSAVRSRDVYEASLAGAPSTPIALRPTKLDGTLEPGQERTFSASINLTTVQFLSRTESLVYPLQVELRSADVTVAVLNSAVIYVYQQPQVPIDFQWTVELSAPISFDPAGVFVDDSLERSLAPGGSLSNQIAALEALTLADHPTAVTVVIAPLLIDQLRRMAGGYHIGDRVVKAGAGGAADAAAALTSLRRIAGSDTVELVAEPFASPSIPALLASGLSRDLEEQTSRGRALVNGALGVDASTTVTRPPGGLLDEATVNRLSADGALLILGDQDTVARPVQTKDFAPPPTGAVQPSNGDPVSVILPDPGSQTLLSGPVVDADPVLASQQVLGELASIWKEAPVPVSGVRGVAITLSSALPAGFWLPFVHRVAGAPFLHPVGAARLASDVPPLDVSRLRSPSTAAFSRAYADSIKRERRNIDTYRSMLAAPSDTPAILATNLLYAESRGFVGDENAGNAFIDDANSVTSAAFAQVRPDTSHPFTLTSHTGTIPLRVENTGATPLKVTIRLRGVGLRFPGGEEQTITAEPGDTILSFPVEVTSSGTITVQVQVGSPSGRVVSQDTFVVRSTAYNRIALMLTFVAGLALIALWSRRFFQRPKT